MSSLLELIRQRYLDTLRAVPARWKVLIVDQYTQGMLQSVLSTYDVLEEGIQQVDLIAAHRQPQPRLAAVYLLMPTTQNVDLVLRDYDPTPPPAQGKSSKKQQHGAPQEPPKYGAAYVNFMEGINDALVGKLTDGLPDNYLQGLKELYINFHALEPRVFSLRTPHSFHTLYGPPDQQPEAALARWEDDIGWMSRSIVNVLATLGEYPLIRYYNPPSSFHSILGPGLAAGEPIGKRLADRVQAEIDAYARDNSDFPPVSDPPRPRGVLFITDRSMDLNAPFLHEFTYQAMCNDLLDVQDGRRYRYIFTNEQGQEEEREAILADDDKVWCEVRHMHMKDALDKLIADFKAYAGEHGGTFGGNGTSINEMKDMLASLPQMREVKEKLSLHLTMAEKCMGLFDKKKLPATANVEQCCATGVTPEGKTPKTLVEEMVPLLDDRGVSSTDKLRIIALYIMHRDGVPEGDKKRLYQHARLALHEMDAVDNLKHLGVNVDKDSGKKRKALFKQREEDDAYDISRYQPQLRYMLEEHFAGKLDQSTFPYVRDAPVSSGSSTLSRSSATASAPPATGSLRSARPQWTSQRAKRALDAPKQRVLVFVAGGATYSEVRSVYKLSEAAGKDIFLGSTHLLTPQQFAADLSSLERGASGHLNKGFAPLKGKPLPPRAPGISQEALDRRYHQKVSAPPPPPQQQARVSPSEGARRPSSIASSLTGRAPSSVPSSVSGSKLTPTASASSAPTSLNGSQGSAGSKIKKKGFLKRLID
ncbi:syntaxin binding protein 1 [Rhodotorula kratochvilovae]